MKESKLEINDVVYTVSVVETSEESYQGLSGIESMTEREGMLFPYDNEAERTFVMRDMNYPLDIIFIDSNHNVRKVVTLQPNDTTKAKGKAQYVLELNAGSGVEKGDTVFFEDEIEEEDNSVKAKQKMFVLGPDGQPQAEIVGGERIFSIKNTKVLIKLAKKAYKQPIDSNFEKLGKKAFQFLDIQESNNPEFVEVPN